MGADFQGYEDFLRHKADRAINTAKVSMRLLKLLGFLSESVSLTNICLDVSLSNFLNQNNPLVQNMLKKNHFIW